MSTHEGQRRVLVVDDNVDAADSIAMLLRMEGHEVDTAYDGSAALESAERLQPEAVILDIGLPGMDGYEIARRIRAHPTLARVRLIALTGYGRPEDREQVKAAGFDHHLVKPADVELLERLVRSEPRDARAARSAP